MIYRKYHPKLIEAQEKLRNNFLHVVYYFDIANTAVALAIESKTSVLLNELLELSKDSSDEIFFKNYKFLIDTLFHLIKWVDKEFKGLSDANASLKAAKINISLFDLENYNYATDFKTQLSKALDMIKEVTEVSQVKNIFAILSGISFPFLFAGEQDSYARIRNFRDRDIPAGDMENDEKVLVVLSIEFQIDNEPWANPQVLKPQEVYTIKGKFSLNQWPAGFNKLMSKAISAQSGTLYDLILPEILPFKSGFKEIPGQIVFKYPQHGFDEDMAIKLLCYFQNDQGEKLIPTVIGYDQLIAKVLDPNSYPFLTGFNAMSKAVFTIADTLQKELPELEKDERNDFLKLLNGVLNYQGFSLQQGIYKNRNNVSEDIFRDNLIQHLIGLPYLGEHIIKEAHLSGGRVEIGYKGLIVELKVEKSISDREQLIKKYGRQPVAYSSGNTKQLSIICILDLTDKNLPPAAPQNSIKLITPEVHGFADGEIPFPSKQVLVIIDGNTKKPSDYSK